MKGKKTHGLGTLDWTKGAGLIPAVVQDACSQRVLMVGWMNSRALETTLKTGRVTFFSRSRKQLWTKGETSGNILRLVSIRKDCDADTLLIMAQPTGPVCHRGTASCFGGKVIGRGQGEGLGFLEILEAIIAQRVREKPRGSYVAGLLAGGLDRAIQKVGEEAVETVIAAKNGSRAKFEGEAADLIFHLMVMLRAKGSSLERIARVLKSRN